MLNLLKLGNKAAAGLAIEWLDGVYAGRANIAEFPAGWARTVSQGIGGACAMSVNARRPVLDIVRQLRAEYGDLPTAK